MDDLFFKILIFAVVSLIGFSLRLLYGVITKATSAKSFHGKMRRVADMVLLASLSLTFVTLFVLPVIGLMKSVGFIVFYGLQGILAASILLILSTVFNHSCRMRMRRAFDFVARPFLTPTAKRIYKVLLAAAVIVWALIVSVLKVIAFLSDLRGRRGSGSQSHFEDTYQADRDRDDLVHAELIITVNIGMTLNGVTLLQAYHLWNLHHLHQPPFFQKYHSTRMLCAHQPTRAST